MPIQTAGPPKHQVRSRPEKPENDNLPAGTDEDIDDADPGRQTAKPSSA